MNAGTESAVLAGLALAAEYQRNGATLTPAVQKDILAEVAVSSDRDEAKQQRNDALVTAFGLLGKKATPAQLLKCLNDFECRVWLKWCWHAQPPDDAEPLQRALFDVCKAARAATRVNGAMDLPRSAKQLSRIVGGHYAI